MENVKIFVHNLKFEMCLEVTKFTFSSLTHYCAVFLFLEKGRKMLMTLPCTDQIILQSIDVLNGVNIVHKNLN